MLSDSLLEGLTFDDVLLKPSRSGVMPSQVETGTLITRNIPLNIPIVSSAMDTVTESHLAIALAREGGIGIIHRNMPIDRQAEEVDRVKRSESGMIVDPVTIEPDPEDLRSAGNHAQLPHLGRAGDGRTTNWSASSPIAICGSRRGATFRSAEVMTKEHLFTVPVGTTLEEARKELHKHRVEKLLVVDDHFTLKGLITVKDIQKKAEISQRRQRRQGPAAGGRGDRRDRRFSGTRAGTRRTQGGRAGGGYRARPQRARAWMPSEPSSALCRMWKSLPATSRPLKARAI